MGKVAGGSRGRAGRVPEKQFAVAGVSWAAQGGERAGRLVGLSVGGEDFLMLMVFIGNPRNETIEEGESRIILGPKPR